MHAYVSNVSFKGSHGDRFEAPFQKERERLFLIKKVGQVIVGSDVCRFALIRRVETIAVEKNSY